MGLKMILPNWALNMKGARLKKKMSVQALADLSGVSHGTIERMEAGEPPNLKSVSAIAEALGMKLSQFFKD